MLTINWYPYTAPIILTDDLFEECVGADLLSVTTPSQRRMGYWLAEIKASEHLHTFLQKTIVTGTYSYSPVLMLEHNWVHRIISIVFLDYEEDRYYTIAATPNQYANLYNKERGILDIALVTANCNCHAYGAYPYKVEVVYETGLYSGTTYQPDILIGLSTYARIILNEMVGYGNEGVGDIGITEFQNQEYSEKRVPLINTNFGNSPEANFANKMFSRYRRLKYVGMR